MHDQHITLGYGRKKSEKLIRILHFLITITITVTLNNYYGYLETNINNEQERYRVEEDFAGMVAYTDEPLADEAWIEDYDRRQEENARELEELSARKSGENPVSSW